MKINNLDPQLVVVTGAGSGIGRATAIRFAKLGAHVVVSDIDLDSAESTAAMIKGAGRRASSVQLDVTDPVAWEAFARDVRAGYGVPDVVVNNAGIVVSGPFLKLSAADWDKQLSINLMGVVHGCRVFGAQMAERGRGGHMVNIASAAAFTPTPVMAPYSVSKAGVKMLSECLRLELAPYGIGVSAICPGVINTNIGDRAVTVGVDPALVARGQQLTKQLQEFAELLPFSPMSPDLVARAAVRAVNYDLAVVPVRAEAWLGYVMHRIAPGINRRMAQPFSFALAEKVAGSLLDRVAPSTATKEPVPSR
ncbi:SDR family NAD(P)-dependent oxidoreductase [Mycobacterium sp. CBMA293]|uniref:SDR family NAD(P)-dependent oxidoreductase n=3 Tax=Mycolicibacterium TaxID=1866885 RepID=UPI00132B8496|nr:MULTISPECIES: SDR family NAD(P)-dependent oxidoreductase [unclassified Mycolicibacterium]MUL48700.1 SDR family NAD(P)-dependent oxidoreductase [Mycolicibacterium sp. CBMA 360]MUL95743.1 SDR family NAD(P)-dependent oxidoreductase [Mycolicibacterium sp. CBMA 230]MUL60802.1 SDR family NAD(P)-dependent oxidoreductase [Mycolicibacterium sp. CBMA 335]MUL71815.1 SDR family NAD(P)-dependent oxidoreductase [Mycolicibacterium sp. CBMA 311]MUM03515.1 oxidoreductase [Mycolicibacterium sp. CBMA 213]